MSMLKVAGKNSSGNATAISVNDSGEAKVERAWKCDSVAVADSVQIRSTDAVWTERFDVKKYATISLRVTNTQDQPVNVIFGADMNSDNTTYMKNYGGSNFGFTIPSDAGYRMLTPEEFPFLQYLRAVRLRLSCSTAPTSGHVSITLVGKY